MKRNLFFSVFVLGASGVFAQTLTPSVISSSGNFVSNSAGMLSSTTGEMALVETFSAGNVIVTQGFQQPEDFNVTVNESAATSLFDVSPNPSAGFIRLNFSDTEKTSYFIQLTDVNGKIIYQIQIEKAAGNNFISFDFSILSSGEYFLTCSDQKSKSAPVTKKLTLIR